MDFKSSGTYDYAPSAPSHGLMLDTGLVHRSAEMYSPQSSSAQPPPFTSAYQQSSHTFPFFEPFSEVPSPVSPMTPAQHFSSILPHPSLRQDVSAPDTLAWRHERMPSGPDWHRTDMHIREPSSGFPPDEYSMRKSFQQHSPTSVRNSEPSPEVSSYLSAHTYLWNLTLLHIAYQFPVSFTPVILPALRSLRISHHQVLRPASVHLPSTEVEGGRFGGTCQDYRRYMRSWLRDDGPSVSICVSHAHICAYNDTICVTLPCSFGNWAVQRCLEAASTPEERRKIVSCMKLVFSPTASRAATYSRFAHRGRVVELASNCYGCHVLQKALDCEEDIRLLIVSELILGDPAQTLVNKHASHVWSKVRFALSSVTLHVNTVSQIMELTWTPPAPPIFA